MAELMMLDYLVTRLRATFAAAREDERGMTIESVLLMAGLAALALAVLVIVTQKVTDKANSIPTQ